MKLEALPTVQGDFNLKNYEETRKTFSWKDAEKIFHGMKQGVSTWRMKPLTNMRKAPAKIK